MAFLAILVVCMVAATIYSIFSTRKSVKARRGYLKERFGRWPDKQGSLESVTAYWDQYRAKHPQEACIDDITWNDLDMDRVFQRLNICQTSVGEESLYQRLRLGGSLPEDWEDCLKALGREKEKRLECQVLLSQMGKAPYSGLTAFLYGTTQVDTPPLPALRFLTALPLAALASIYLIGPWGILLFLGAVLTNLVISALFKNKVGSQLSAIRYFAKLLWCTQHLQRYAIPGMEAFFQRIKHTHSLFAALRSKVSSMSSEAMSYSSMDAFGEFAKLFFLMDVRAYARSLRTLRRHPQEALALYDLVGQLDAMIAVASFRKSLDCWCAPEFTQEMRLEMERMGHPLILHPVANSAQLRRDTLITGSNASGKSTFLKAVAVNALLGQTLNTCAARRFVMPRALVISSMALKDDLLRGDSYFIAEIKSFKRIMERAQAQPCLCFVDEILRGTNTIERIAASAAVLYTLAREKNCLCLVASHDIELTRILQEDFDNYHFAETVAETGVTFDYCLKPGPSNTRNAILLLSTMGFDPRVIDQAHQLISAFETTQSWPVFEVKEAEDAAAQA